MIRRPREHVVNTHTRVKIETMDYECAERDCTHVSPIGRGQCPTYTWECCKECSDRNWDECEGPVITWDECGGTGATFAEVDAEDTHTFEPDCCASCSRWHEIATKVGLGAESTEPSPDDAR